MENVTAVQVKDALERVIASFQTVLYEDDEQFLENMKTKNLEGDDIRRYQGVDAGCWFIWILASF